MCLGADQSRGALYTGCDQSVAMQGCGPEPPQSLGAPVTGEGDWGQGLTAPSDPPGAEPSAPASQKMAGGSPLHFMKLPVFDALHRTKTGGRPPQHQDPDRGLPPSS